MLNSTDQPIAFAYEPSALLAAIVESSDDAIVSKSLEGIITSWNRGAERIFGYTAIEAVGKPITLLIPPDRLDEEPAILARIQSGERVDHFETVRRRKDGQLIDLSLTISPIRTPDGTIVGASKIARDISDRRRGQEQQALLLHEMNHRIKNLFALTGGMLSLAAREAETPADLVSLMRDRLVALARAHDLTLRSHDADPASAGNISLFALLNAMLAPHKSKKPRLILAGEDIEFMAPHVTSLALLFHEFTTNAAKYGALNSEEGFIEIRTRPLARGFQAVWSEHGGPAVQPPAVSRGFGTKLESTLKASLGATIMREWRREGVVVTVVFPRSICHVA